MAQKDGDFLAGEEIDDLYFLLDRPVASLNNQGGQHSLHGENIGAYTVVRTKLSFIGGGHLPRLPPLTTGLLDGGFLDDDADFNMEIDAVVFYDYGFIIHLQ